MRLTEEQFATLQTKHGKSSRAADVVAAPKADTLTAINDYKTAFLEQLHLAGLPQPAPEITFAKPRRWRFDWAYTDRLIAIEYQGGNYTGKGGHNTVRGLARDYEKFTEAALRGWMLILIDAVSVRDGRALAWTERALRARMKEVLP